MAQGSAGETSGIEIVNVISKWKWLLVFSGAVILAGGLAFVLVQSRTNFTLGVMMPRQISFSFIEKEEYTLAAKSLNKYDFDRLALFLLNRDLFEQYLNEEPGRCLSDVKKPKNLQAVIIPKYALDFSNAAVRNETLQYLLFKVNPEDGLPVTVVNRFVLNVFKNYYLLRIFQDYYNHLQAIHINSLDSQRDLLEQIEELALKTARLHGRGKKNPGIFTNRGDFLLQVSAENERYLDLPQQLAANDILLNDKKTALALNQEKTDGIQALLRSVDELSQRHLQFFFRDPSLAKQRLLKMQKAASDKGLALEYLKLAALFDVIDNNFKIFNGDARMFMDRFLILKALVFCFFAFGLLLLSILVLENGKKSVAQCTRSAGGQIPGLDR